MVERDQNKKIQAILDFFRGISCLSIVGVNGSGVIVIVIFDDLLAAMMY